MSTKYMVETQIKPRGIVDRAVLQAMIQVPRDRFVPHDYQNLAFSDCPLPIADSQTISQPYMVAAMTEMLRLDATSKVLEIGTGSGYQTAVLAEVCSQVYTVEILESLSQNAGQLLAELGYQHIHYRLADGHSGWCEHAPFDGIIVTAAPERVPVPLTKQLKVGARMVIPVGLTAESQELRIIEKISEENITETCVMPVRFVPLVGGA